MDGQWLTYLLVFVSSASVCAVLTPGAIKVAVHRGMLDRRDRQVRSLPPPPILGGGAIVVSFVIAVLAFIVTKPQVGPYEELGIVVALAAGLSLVGLVDDVRQLPSSWHVGAEIAAAVLVWSAGGGVTAASSEMVNLCLTVLWFFVVTNAFRFLDNTDGVAAGLTTITCLTLFAIGSASGQFIVAALSIGLAGSASGFLGYNWHPARVRMGDCGALFVGFLIAYLAIICDPAAPRGLRALLGVAVCSYALLDTSLVVISRLSAGNSRFRGGTGNISDRLLGLGLPVPTAVKVAYVVATVIGILSFMISVTSPRLAWCLVGLVGLAMAVGGILLLVRSSHPADSNENFVDQGRGRS